MKYTKLLLLLLILAAGAFSLASPLQAGSGCGGHEATTSPSFWEAHKSHAAKAEVTVVGTVKKILAEDHKGTAHQRFILKVENLSILVAHNIDLAPRVPVKVGDEVILHGEYIYKDKGGVLHWTHRDPRHKHPDGWICFQGKIYQ